MTTNMSSHDFVLLTGEMLIYTVLIMAAIDSAKNEILKAIRESNTKSSKG